MIWIDLIYNLAILVALSVVSGFVDLRWKRGTNAGALLQGALFGCAAAIGMLRPFVLGPGLIFDGRSAMISLSGLFFGPLAAATACLATVPLRIWQGGAGVHMGVAVILCSAAIGAICHRARRETQGPISVRKLYAFGIAVHLAMLAMTTLLPDGSRLPVFRHIAMPVMLIYPLATVLIGKILSDQAEQDRLLASLKEERERLAGILKGTHAGTWEWNVQTGELKLNERWAEIVGTTLPEISPTTIETWVRFAHPEDLKASDELLQRHFRGELDYYEIELRMKHVRGEWVWVLDRGRVTSWTADGKPLMMMGTHQDITERKEAEAERIRLHADLLQAQKMESVGRLAGGVAHDFNNILTVILGHAEVALAQTRPETPLHGDLLEIRRAAERSADLTRQLLAFARKQTVAPKLLDLNETVGGMVPMLKRLIGEGVGLEWRPAADAPKVRMDPSQLDQILVNLCANSRDAIGGVGTIAIGTETTEVKEEDAWDGGDRAPGKYAALTVADTGKGMDREALEHLFEPFYTTKGVGEGTGLGLATIYGIVKQNGGHVRVESMPGAGTTFRIFLPLRDGLAETAAERPGPVPAARGHETVLLVEDEPSILRLAKGLVQAHGYEVLAAGSPAEALRLAKERAGAIHLLMTDVVMPEMNGRDLARALKATHPEIKCLFMSGYTADVIAENGVLHEGVHFIQKPFSGDELAAGIRAALDASPG